MFDESLVDAAESGESAFPSNGNFSRKLALVGIIPNHFFSFSVRLEFARSWVRFPAGLRCVFFV